ncbi:unnamed protein product [Vitrella brassicaformis CCMP3155]|uniref:Chaperone protein DnaJ n=2 Tax=Vitrella brassicaformis TaxID=1169539 RepID=A0A0G4EXB2_VITBC|nr:unnamed protein product [Vitrella brassicaformis CCMP3155]|eukprot:CEM03433.1 unnamed protein product [Vitrella brassicaformis CCMP3155]
MTTPARRLERMRQHLHPARRPSDLLRTRLLMADDEDVQTVTTDSVTKDYYKILGVDRGASKKEITKRYKDLLREFHPDFGGDKYVMMELNEAYEVLADDARREVYDRTGQAPPSAEQQQQQQQQQMAGQPTGGWQEIGFNDIFDTFFGGGMAGGRRRRAARRGSDLKVELEVDFATAVFGGTEKVRLKHVETCEVCMGTGAAPGTKPVVCPTCNGQGMVFQEQRTPVGYISTGSTCPTCGGVGEILADPCPACNGQGLVQRTKQIDVAVPAGVEEGMKLRIKGEGDAGMNGGEAGDLFVFVKVRPDSRFTRKGTSIFSETTISYTDAILGKTVDVEVIDGTEPVRIPPGTQPGTTIKVPGKGAPKVGIPDFRGDHFTTVKVEIPTSVSGRERELIEELDRLRPSSGSREEGGRGKRFFGL